MVKKQIYTWNIHVLVPCCVEREIILENSILKTIGCHFPSSRHAPNCRIKLGVPSLIIHSKFIQPTLGLHVLGHRITLGRAVEFITLVP